MMKPKSEKRLGVLLVTLFAAMPLLERSAMAAEHDLPAQLIRYADLVLFNGQVLTVDAGFSVAEALAARDGRVLAVCASEDMLKLAGPDTEHVDLAGRTLTPGYIYNDGDNAVPGGDIYKDTMVGGLLKHQRRQHLRLL